MNNLEKLSFNIKNNKSTITVLGLGYVGLPVAYYFSKKYKVVGFDINKKRVINLRKGIDDNKTFKKFDIKKTNIVFEFYLKNTHKSDIFIITTPTPINKVNKPNLEYIFNALNSLIDIGIKDKLIILESTVYPGATEENFIKYLEKKTTLKVNHDFWFGYSPERINPGDKKHKFFNIDKIVSGSSKKVSSIVKKLYKKVVSKVHEASSIRMAETAKLIENSQRDLNVAFVNEIALVCDKFNLKSKEALKLASTKWNFINFKPGLVGGHCIGVDPYYLFYALKKKKYRPKVLLNGRSLNEEFANFLVKKYLNNLKKDKPKILIMGATYKADCNDLRNSKSFKLYEELKKRKCKTNFYDPHISEKNFKEFKKYNFIKTPQKNYYDGVIISVDHIIFKNMGYNKILSFVKKESIILDVKGIFPENKRVMHI